MNSRTRRDREHSYVQGCGKIASDAGDKIDVHDERGEQHDNHNRLLRKQRRDFPPEHGRTVDTRSGEGSQGLKWAMRLWRAAEKSADKRSSNSLDRHTPGAKRTGSDCRASPRCFRSRWARMRCPASTPKLSPAARSTACGCRPATWLGDSWIHLSEKQVDAMVSAESRDAAGKSVSGLPAKEGQQRGHGQKLGQLFRG